MAEYKLYCFAQSGNAYRAALMLNLIGADWQPIYVDFFKGGETRRIPFQRLEESAVADERDLDGLQKRIGALSLRFIEGGEPLLQLGMSGFGITHCMSTGQSQQGQHAVIRVTMQPSR